MTTTKRILVVDDEESLTFSLYKIFIQADSDYEVLTASSGEEAWGKISEQPFDLVVTDISMPGMSGLELLEKIKKHSPNTTVIVMTAFFDEFNKEEAIAKGAKHFIEKPFEIKKMRNLVVETLEN
ncbi:MAG: response regulator [Calditrichaeota bacterium]|nr:response regulator [Calditrichota bacterium]